MPTCIDSMCTALLCVMCMLADYARSNAVALHGSVGPCMLLRWVYNCCMCDCVVMLRMVLCDCACCMFGGVLWCIFIYDFDDGVRCVCWTFAVVMCLRLSILCCMR